MIVIGVTGSIGMGKSTLTTQLAQLGAKTLSADGVVHQLLAKDGKAVKQVAERFAAAYEDGAINRKTLGALVFNHPQARKQLEAIIHPLVVAAENKFVVTQKRLGAKLVVLDIPLLFETGADKRVDVTITVTAPAFLQRRRVMQRAGMTEEKYRAIVASQMADRKKRKAADIVIHTGLGKAYAMRQLKKAITLLDPDFRRDDGAL